MDARDNSGHNTRRVFQAFRDDLPWYVFRAVEFDTSDSYVCRDDTGLGKGLVVRAETADSALARFLSIERRPAERSGKGIVGRF